MIPLLDHGFVRYIDHMGSDLSISRAARCSYASPPRTEDEKLLHYLWKNHHTTPFEAVTFTFEIKAPIFVMRQWHRHRTQSYNELSARYKELPEEFYVPDPMSVGMQSQSSKQARVVTELTSQEIAERTRECQIVRDQNERAFATYRMLMHQGWPRELARSVLPVSTYSHMFATMNLLNLMKFLTLRCHSHAQYEIRVYAEAMREIAREHVPIAISAWEGSP